MNNQVAIRPVAFAEIQKIADYYDERGDDLGSEFIAAVKETVAKIGENPFLYAIVFSDVRSVLVRQYPYAIKYFVEDDSAVVIAVVHTARDPALWERRRRS